MSEEKPNIEIPDPLLDASQLFRGQTEEIRKSFNTLIYFVIGVMLTGIVMMFFTVVSIAFQSWQFNKEAENALKQVEIQEQRIQSATSQQGAIQRQLEEIKKNTDTAQKNKIGQ